MEDCCPRGLGTALLLWLLLLLPVPTAGAESFLNPSSSGWPLYHPKPDSFHSYQGPETRHQDHKEDDVLQYCDGVFDVYYILDSSRTMKQWSALVGCWEDMVEKLVNPKQRLSLIRFSTTADIKIPLTSNRTEILHSISSFKRYLTSGETNLNEGLKKANEQIVAANAGAVKNVSTMIIIVLSGYLRDDVYRETMAEVNKARNRGVYIYCIGVDTHNRNQVLSIADSPENAFLIKGTGHELHPEVDNVGTRTCLELRYVQPPVLCENARHMLLQGYGFHNARTTDKIICRYRLSATNIIDRHATNMNMTVITCPKPKSIQAGQTISVEVSINNGMNFLAHPVAVKIVGGCDAQDAQGAQNDQSTNASGNPLQDFFPSLENLAVPQSLADIFPQAGNSPELFVTLVLGLLLTPVLLWWAWWLCCRTPQKEPPPALQTETKPEDKKPGPRPRLPSPAPLHRAPPPPPPPSPAPAPPVPVTVCPVVIICCCACRGVCMNRGPEGTVASCSFGHPSCHWVPVLSCQSSNQGSCTNLDFLKALCSQAPCDLTTSFQPSQESLPLANCWQCHHPQAGAPSLLPGRCRCSLACPAQPVEPRHHCFPGRE